MFQVSLYMNMSDWILHVTIRSHASLWKPQSLNFISLLLRGAFCSTHHLCSALQLYLFIFFVKPYITCHRKVEHEQEVVKSSKDQCWKGKNEYHLCSSTF